MSFHAYAGEGAGWVSEDTVSPPGRGHKRYRIAAPAVQPGFTGAPMRGTASDLAAAAGTAGLLLLIALACVGFAP